MGRNALRRESQTGHLKSHLEFACSQINKCFAVRFISKVFPDDLSWSHLVPVTVAP